MNWEHHHGFRHTCTQLRRGRTRAGRGWRQRRALRALVPASRASTPAILDDTLTEADIESVIAYAKNAKAKNTQVAYASDWRSYTRSGSRGAAWRRYRALLAC